jgi:hypothetical protein
MYFECTRLRVILNPDKTLISVSEILKRDEVLAQNVLGIVFCRCAREVFSRRLSVRAFALRRT